MYSRLCATTSLGLAAGAASTSVRAAPGLSISRCMRRSSDARRFRRGRFAAAGRGRGLALFWRRPRVALRRFNSAITRL